MVTPLQQGELFPALARQAGYCRCCGRALTNPVSVQMGPIPICRAHQERAMPETAGDAAALPFDPITRDIVCRRAPEDAFVVTFNIPCRHHSPTGMEFGYGGSGPADFALNILAIFIPTPPDPGPPPRRGRQPRGVGGMGHG
jgi:hypothetical protein